MVGPLVRMTMSLGRFRELVHSVEAASLLRHAANEGFSVTILTSAAVESLETSTQSRLGKGIGTTI